MSNLKNVTYNAIMLIYSMLMLLLGLFSLTFFTYTTYSVISHEIKYNVLNENVLKNISMVALKPEYHIEYLILAIFSILLSFIIINKTSLIKINFFKKDENLYTIIFGLGFAVSVVLTGWLNPVPVLPSI